MVYPNGCQQVIHMNSDDNMRNIVDRWRSPGIGANPTFRCFLCSKSVSITSGNSVQRRVPGLAKMTRICLACDARKQ
jgi:hypothetical protein